MRICKRVVKTMNPRKGSFMFSRQTGNLQAHGYGVGEWRYKIQDSRGSAFADRETGPKWKVWTELEEGEGMNGSHWVEKGVRRLRFEVERLE